MGAQQQVLMSLVEEPFIAYVMVTGVNGTVIGYWNEGINTAGTLTPSTFGVTTAIERWMSTSANDLQFQLDGVFAQNTFESLLVEDQTGVFRSYTSASATFITGGGNTLWTWGTGSNRVWTAGGQTRSVRIILT